VSNEDDAYGTLCLKSFVFGEDDAYGTLNKKNKDWMTSIN